MRLSILLLTLCLHTKNISASYILDLVSPTHSERQEPHLTDLFISIDGVLGVILPKNVIPTAFRDFPKDHRFDFKFGENKFRFFERPGALEFLLRISEFGYNIHLYSELPKQISAQVKNFFEKNTQGRGIFSSIVGVKPSQKVREFSRNINPTYIPIKNVCMTGIKNPHRAILIDHLFYLGRIDPYNSLPIPRFWPLRGALEERTDISNDPSSTGGNIFDYLIGPLLEMRGNKSDKDHKKFMESIVEDKKFKRWIRQEAEPTWFELFEHYFPFFFRNPFHLCMKAEDDDEVLERGPSAEEILSQLSSVSILSDGSLRNSSGD